ncbi:MAG: tyrosine-type recombinase/integrase, partial [Pseudomonadales bacterium]|nr:tyrosine-type recombinase/integrase [Pseudomonadales bacterium]
MPRIAKPLSPTQVLKAKAKENEYTLADGKGLGLRIKPNGSKRWLFNYSRPYTKRRTNISLGPYPDVSLSEAREARLEAEKLLAKDIDPREHWIAQERANNDLANNTLNHVTKLWIETRTKITQAHREDVIGSLEKHILPKLGKIPISRIKAPDAISALKPLANQEKLETVGRVAQRLNEVMMFAVNAGLITNNPLAGIRKVFAPPSKKNMPTLKPDELPEFMELLSRAKIHVTTRQLILWQLHTMVRPGEAAGTQWDEIDLEDAVWVISPERMKMKRGHTVPLSTQCLAILECMKPISGHLEHVFPASRIPKNHTNDSTANMALKRMGLKGRLVAHGMRSIASTILNEQRFDFDVIESALAHTDKNKIRAAYNHAEYLEPRRVMMSW